MRSLLLPCYANAAKHEGYLAGELAPGPARATHLNNRRSESLVNRKDARRMPIFGIRIQKEEGGIPFENRYFTVQGDMDLAQGYAGLLVNFEKAIHGSPVVFKKVNIWEIGASPRRHRSVIISGTGLVSSTQPTALEMCVKIVFGATDSYPYYKEYRVAVDDDNTNTRAWNAPYLAAVFDAIEAADDLDVWSEQTTKTGATLADPVVEVDVTFSQLHKRWYNRTS